MRKNALFIGALATAMLAYQASPSTAAPKKATGERDWHVTQTQLSDAPLQDYMLMYNAGGVDGAVAVIGLPSFRTFRHIQVGVDLHEPVFSGSSAGNKNGTPDGKYLYVNDKGANTIGIINLQSGFLERLIAMPFPYGIHHISQTPDGKTLFSTGELTGKMGKTDIATGKTQIIDCPPAPSAPDYLDVSKDGKYVFAGNYYHSTTMVFSTNPFKMIKEIPVGKNPHGHDVIPNNKYLLVSDKLSATMTIIDIDKLAVKKVIPTGAGPLHTVMDTKNKYAYESCFVADSVAKIDLDKLEVADEFPVHYRIGHISISADDKFVMALNKFSTGLFASTGMVYPVNHEMLDVDEKSPTYGKTLKIMPVDGEPHNAKVIFANMIKDWTMGQLEDKGLIKSETQALMPHHHAEASFSFAPRDNEKPGVVQKGDVKEIHIRAFSYGYVPRQVRVNKGDKVRLIVTNIDKAAGLTKNPDVTMGLTIYGPYGLRTNIKLPRGITAISEFVADTAGEYEFYCTHFCGPLHLEMRGTFFVDGPKGPANLANGDYAEAQNIHGLLGGGKLEKAKVVEKL